MKNFSHYLNIIMSLTLFCTHLNVSAMIVKVACLKKYMSKKKPHKIVILSDKHAFSSDEINKEHVDDMNELIAITSKNVNPIPFLIEMSETHKDPERLKNLVQSPSNVAIKLALDNNMKYGNINFIAFDNRQSNDFWIRDMLYQTDAFIQAIQQNYEFPIDFYHITAENILQQLNARYKTNIKIIAHLPAHQSIKDHYNVLNEQRHKESTTYITALFNTYDLKHQQHLFTLIVKLNDNEKNKLYITLTEENCFTIDMHLLQKAFIASDDNPLSIINAGAYHSHHLESRLLSHFPGFEKDISSSMSLPGLKMDNFYTISYPAHVPNHFMTDTLRNFISNHE